MKMKVKCYNCGLVCEKKMSEGECPECGFNLWFSLPKKDKPETMMEVTMKERAKREKEEGLAFEIFDVEDGKKVNVRKIYYNGHIEGFKHTGGFKGNPCIINHIFPKIQAIKYFAQNMNKEYRDLMLKCLAMDFYPVRTLDSLYQRNKETIEKL